MDISFEQVEYRYSAGTPFEKLALEDLNLLLPSQKYTAIIGHTGSGKSTLLQHLNALLKPTSGKVVIGEYEITPKKKNKQLKPIRKRVGIVFQFPEHQLFEETVLKDICYGPLNFGVSEEEAERRARQLIVTVGLDEDILERSPFDLSGGQKRRVAIAGVLAMDPDVLVLDEPTAGLDPRGRTDIMDMFHNIHLEKELTTVLVTHSMEDAARYADELVIMQKGKLVGKGSPQEIFSKPEWLFSLGLDVPEAVKFQYSMEQQLGHEFGKTCLTIEEIADEVKTYMESGGGS
jgi:energy-coupling factor transport system ATP-binding protein